MSDVRHERRFRDFRGTSAYPPRLAVKADIPDRQVCANSVTSHRSKYGEIRHSKSAIGQPHADPL